MLSSIIYHLLVQSNRQLAVPSRQRPGNCIEGFGGEGKGNTELLELLYQPRN